MFISFWDLTTNSVFIEKGQRREESVRRTWDSSVKQYLKILPFIKLCFSMIMDGPGGHYSK